MEERFEIFTVLLNRINRNIRKIKNEEMANYELRSPHISCLYYLYISKELTSKELSYGGGCINDVVVHLATSEMGFGGVGESGMGSYHGKDGFEAFSHYKSIMDKKTWLDLPMRYQPYKSKLYEKLLHMFLR